MKTLFFTILFGFGFAQANCPELGGTYVCKTKERTDEMYFKQETVDGVEKFELPTANGQITVLADGKKYGDDTSYTIAKCEKGKLIVEEFEKEGDERNVLTYLGIYKYWTNKKKNLEANIYVEVGLNDDIEKGSENFKCNRKN